MSEQSFPIQLRALVEDKQVDLIATLPPQIDPERFIRVSLLAVTKNKELWKCSKESVFLAIMESARVGLQIDNKEAALIPYGGHAEFMPMVQGIIRLMLRSPGLVKVEARVVRDGDEFDFEYGLRPNLVHRPLNLSGDVTHAYAIMWRQGADPTFEVMDREEIEQVRLTSRATNSPAWKNWYPEMARKVVLKRLSKYADLSPEASRAIEIDHAITGLPWGGDYVDGISDEYRNSLVKSQTQQGIDRLKDQMENGDTPEPEPKTEPEPETHPEPATEPDPEPRPKNKWEPEVVDFLVETQLVDGKDAKQVKSQIRKILNRSPFMDVPFGELDIVEATAFVVGRLLVLEEFPKLENEARYAQLLEWWADDEKKQDLIARALTMIPPEEPSE